MSATVIVRRRRQQQEDSLEDDIISINSSDLDDFSEGKSTAFFPALCGNGWRG